MLVDGDGHPFIDRLLADIRARLKLPADCEITLEANPGTFEAERFAAYRSAGVNRLSMWKTGPYSKTIGDAGSNFLEASLDSLAQDTDVEWRPRVAQWPAIGETMAKIVQSALVGQVKSQQALDDANGIVARAAERLRIRRTTLVEKMRKYGMSRREGDEQADD